MPTATATPASASANAAARSRGRTERELPDGAPEQVADPATQLQHARLVEPREFGLELRRLGARLLQAKAGLNDRKLTALQQVDMSLLRQALQAFHDELAR